MINQFKAANSSYRLKKVENLIREVLAEEFERNEILDKEGNKISIIITRIAVTSDLKLAKIFVKPFNQKNINSQEFLQIIEQLQPSMRRLLGKNLYLKYVPNLVFKFDQSLDPDAYINQFLK